MKAGFKLYIAVRLLRRPSGTASKGKLDHLKLHKCLASVRRYCLVHGRNETVREHTAFATSQRHQ